MKKARYNIFFFLLLLISEGLLLPQGIEIIKIGEWGTGPYIDTFIQGNYAYCAASEAGLDIIDITNPSIPKKVGNCDTSDHAYGVYVSQPVEVVVNIVPKRYNRKIKKTDKWLKQR